MKIVGLLMIMMTKMMRIAVAVAVVFGANGAMAKVSDDNRLFRQVDNINAAFKLCELSTGPLDEIRAKAIATGVTSGVATVASGVATVSSIMAAKDSSGTKTNNWDTSTTTARGKVGEANKSLRGKRMASTVASGIATGANAVSLVISGTSWSNLKKLMSDADDCSRALNNISLSVPVRTEN